jgi:beta-lactamase class A
MVGVRLGHTGGVSAREMFDELGVCGAAYAAPISGRGIGLHAGNLVTPASVGKIQIALAVEDAIATGALDGMQQRTLPAQPRTAGPVGISLLRDEVRMSVRDLVTLMLTISDNVATDELIALVGVDRINRLTAGLGLTSTRITGDLRSLLDDIAGEAGFADYPALAIHDPTTGPPSLAQVQRRLHRSSALDPTRGWSTTAADTVRLLQAIWTDTAASSAACVAVRQGMAGQLTRHRIASGFGPDVTVAAKSGGLMGLVRNEAGVVSFPDHRQYAVAVFTRSTPATTTDPAHIDTGIGRIARTLIDELRS